jgi:hypothetical protein
MAHAHAHSSTVMYDALQSLPPLRRGVKLGLLRVGVSAPSAPPTWSRAGGAYREMLLQTIHPRGIMWHSRRLDAVRQKELYQPVQLAGSHCLRLLL